MRGKASTGEIVQLLSMANGCDYRACRKLRCGCQDQASVMVGHFHVLRRRMKGGNRTKVRYSKEETDQILSMSSEGRSLNEIAVKLGRNKGAVWQKVRSLRKAGALSVSGRVAAGKRADDILAFVRTFIAERGHPPTYKTICGALGIKHTSQVGSIIRSLEARGRIVRSGSLILKVQ